MSPKTLGKLNYLFEGSDKLSSITIKDVSGIAPLIINIDSAKRITTNGHTSYIFSIKPTTPRAIAFKNLTIDESAEGTLAYITTYKPTREWIDAWRLGRYIEFKGDIKFELLNLNDLTIKKTSSNQIKQVSCITVTIWIPIGMHCTGGNPEVSGPGGVHYPGQACPYDGTSSGPYTAYQPTYVTECVDNTPPPSGGGGGGGGTTPDPGGYDPCIDPTVSSTENSIAGVPPPTPCDEPDPNEPQPLKPGEAVISGKIVNTTNYPGKNEGFPWLWWEDDSFINTLDINPYLPNNLNLAEKNLIKLYPFEATALYRNRIAAEAETIRLFNRNGRNDLSDAFRHAFFNALNYRDCKLSSTGVNIAKLFSDAHETTTPAVLELEKLMDLYNNAKGHSIGTTASAFTLNSTLSAAVMTKLFNGELRYLSPLDNVLSKDYDLNWDGVQDCPTCLNGIIDITFLTPSNL